MDAAGRAASGFCPRAWLGASAATATVGTGGTEGTEDTEEVVSGRPVAHPAARPSADSDSPVKTYHRIARPLAGSRTPAAHSSGALYRPALAVQAGIAERTRFVLQKSLRLGMVCRRRGPER